MAAAKRELKEEINLVGTPKIVTIKRLLTYDKNTGGLVDDKLIYLCLVKNPKGKLISNEEGTYELTREKFEEIKNRRVAPGWTVEEFVNVRIDFLEVKIEDGKYVTDLSRIQETERLLRRKIAETGQTVTEFMLETIKNALSQSN